VVKTAEFGAPVGQGFVLPRPDFSLPHGLHAEPREGLTLLFGDGSLPLELRRRNAQAHGTT
jgi:hypothetical protein